MKIKELIKETEQMNINLFCERISVNDKIIRYYDDDLKDMWDHNYYECDDIDENCFESCKEYSKNRKEIHLKFISQNPNIEFLKQKGFECSTILTMLKKDNEFKGKLNNEITFKNVKEDNIYNDLLELQIKHYGETYGIDFCKRQMSRLVNAAKEKNSCLNYFAAYIDNKIVGMCSIVIGNNIIGLDDLLTDIDYRNQYVAKTLMKYVYDKYNVLMYLHADADDTPKDMYEKLGFEIVDKTYEYFYMEK